MLFLYLKNTIKFYGPLFPFGKLPLFTYLLFSDYNSWSKTFLPGLGFFEVIQVPQSPTFAVVSPSRPVGCISFVGSVRYLVSVSAVACPVALSTATRYLVWLLTLSTNAYERGLINVILLLFFAFFKAAFLVASGGPNCCFLVL
jgi:hypothetical protein